MRLHVLAAAEATSVILGGRARVTSASGPRPSPTGIIETDTMADAQGEIWEVRNSTWAAAPVSTPTRADANRNLTAFASPQRFGRLLSAGGFSHRWRGFSAAWLPRPL